MASNNGVSGKAPRSYILCFIGKSNLCFREGFNVLLYGLGSKRLLINKFYKKMIPDEPTLIINGFFPSLTIKEVIIYIN